MKQIKGIYKEELKSHESINDYEFNDYDYFIKDNGNFTYSLNYAYYDEDELIVENVCKLSQNYKQQFTKEQIKQKVIDFQKNK